MTVIRPAKPEDDLGEHLDGRYIVIEDDEGIAAWGGVENNFMPVAVMKLKRSVNPSTLARAARSFRSIFDQYDAVIAHRGPQKSADRFLTWMGFELLGEEDGVAIYQWKKTDS